MRGIIIGGVPIDDRAAEYIKPGDFIVCCDSGMYNADRLGITPSLIVGDFDSHPEPETDIEIIKLPREKDDTDSVYAVRQALERGCDDIVMLGCVGGRLDHTLGNVYVLLDLFERGVHGMIYDGLSELEIVGSSPVYVDSKYPFFSLVNISGKARGITVTGAKYPLSGGEIKCTYQYGVSNEVSGSRACITVSDGNLLLIKDL